MKEAAEIQTHSNSFPLLTIASLLVAITIEFSFLTTGVLRIFSLGHKEQCFRKTNTSPECEKHNLRILLPSKDL